MWVLYSGSRVFEVYAELMGFLQYLLDDEEYLVCALIEHLGAWAFLASEAVRLSRLLLIDLVRV